MDPMTLMLILGGTGLAKSELIDRPKEQRQRILAAKTALYSPWTGMSPDKVQEADPFGNTLQGVTAGAMYGQQSEANSMAKEELAMKKNYYDALGKSLTPSAAAGPATPAVGANSYTKDMQFGDPSLRKSKYQYAY